MIMIFPTLIILSLGFLITSLLLRNESNPNILERLCFAYPIGIGFTTMQIFLLGIAQAPLTLPIITGIVLFEIVVLFIWIYYENITIWDINVLSNIAFNLRQDKKKFIIAILTLWAGLKLGAVFLETGMRPIFAWDSFTNWSARAKVFYHSNSLLLNTSVTDFYGKGVIDSYINYPPLNPLMQMWMALWAGNFDEVQVKFWSPFLLICVAAYIYSVGLKEINRLAALGILIIFLSSPLLSLHATEVYSDLPLGVCLVFALSSFLNIIRGKIEYLCFIGLFASIAVFTKDEAIFFVIPLLISCCLFLWGKIKDETYLSKSILPQLLIPYLFILPWIYFKLAHGLGLGAESIKFELTYRPDMLFEYIKLFVGLQNFNVIFMFLPMMLLFSRKISNELLFLIFPVVCYFVFFVLLCIFTKFYSSPAMFETSVFRNILSYYPSACLLIILLLKQMINTEVRIR